MQQDQLDARTALGEVRRIDGHVRERGRWAGWAWLALAVITPIFMIVTWAYSGDVAFVTAIAFGVFGLLLVYAESRQQVIRHTTARLSRPVTWMYAGLVVLGVVLKFTLLPDGFSIWLLIVGLAPALPCLYGAWQVLRR